MCPKWLGPREQSPPSKDPGIHLSGWGLEKNFSGHGSRLEYSPQTGDIDTHLSLVYSKNLLEKVSLVKLGTKLASVFSSMHFFIFISLVLL